MASAPFLPLGVRSIELPDQLRDTARAVTLRGLMQQQQMDSMQMRAYQEQQAREAQIDAIIDNAPMDPMQKALLKSPAGKKALAERLFAKGEPDKFLGYDNVVGPDGRPVAVEKWSSGPRPSPFAPYEKPPKPSGFEAELLAAGLKPGTPEWDKAWQSRISKETTHAPAPSATATIVNDQSLGKPAMNKVDEQLLEVPARVQQLEGIRAQFKPEFQELGTRWSNLLSASKEKLGFKLDQKDKVALQEFSAYKRNAIGALNDYIKAITGAALSEVEAQRIMKAMPNPGLGLFDGDSPTEFEAKFNDSIRQAKLAQARLVYIKRSGGVSMFDAQGNPAIPLERIPAIMRQRENELFKTYQSRFPEMPEDQRRSAVKRQLAQEFGLTAD